tara:strand:- start:168 stop:1016 length:849 start_codon:yes stop_codon:yes gene_type:complete
MDKNKQQTFLPGLYLVSTPIGNIEDISLRALNVLKKSDIIFCEDTRRSIKILSHFKIKNKLEIYQKFNEKKVSQKIINFIKGGKIISLVSDAGTPTISDPGMILVNRCIEENLNIYPIPGVSAVTAAVSVSGFSDKYLFYGFLEKKQSKVENVFKVMSSLDYSIVFFIPGNKINFFISKFKKYFLDRKIMIAKEMTKVYESYTRNSIEKVKNFPENVKGEFTVVISEIIKDKKVKKNIPESAKIEINKMLKKYTHKDVVEFISKKENLSKKMVYEFCLKLKK